MQSEKYKTNITKALKDETAFTDAWVNVNIFGSTNAILEAASLASQIKGESFPSSNAPGGHAIVQRRAHGAM